MKLLASLGHISYKTATTEFINKEVCELVIIPCLPVLQFEEGVQTPTHNPSTLQFQARCVKWRSGGERRGLLARLCGLPPNKEPVTRLVKTHHTRHVAPYTHPTPWVCAKLPTSKRADDLVSSTLYLGVLATGHWTRPSTQVIYIRQQSETEWYHTQVKCNRGEHKRGRSLVSRCKGRQLSTGKHVWI